MTKTKNLHSKQLLSILIPLYNEEETIAILVSKVIKQKFMDWEKEIILIDDGSTDKSFLQIKQFSSGITVLQNKTNLGKGAAIRKGIEQAHGDVIVFQDADLEYNPKDIATLLTELSSTNVAAVYGSRNVSNTQRGYFFYFWGGIVISKLMSILYSTKLTDVCTGYKMFHRSVLKRIPIENNDFSFEVELTCKILKNGEKISEVPIRYQPRAFSDGKKIRAWDGFKDIWVLLKTRYFSK